MKRFRRLCRSRTGEVFERHAIFPSDGVSGKLPVLLEAVVVPLVERLTNPVRTSERASLSVEKDTAFWVSAPPMSRYATFLVSRQAIACFSAIGPLMFQLSALGKIRDQVAERAIELIVRFRFPVLRTSSATSIPFRLLLLLLAYLPTPISLSRYQNNHQILQRWIRIR